MSCRFSLQTLTKLEAAKTGRGVGFLRLAAVWQPTNRNRTALHPGKFDSSLSGKHFNIAINVFQSFSSLIEFSIFASKVHLLCGPFSMDDQLPVNWNQASGRSLPPYRWQRIISLERKKLYAWVARFPSSNLEYR